MNRVGRTIETILFASRWLLVPIYLAMILLLGMLVVFFLADIVHALPNLLKMTENSLVIFTLSLIDLSLSANLVVIVILSGYENFVSRVSASERDGRPEWLTKIDFSELKLKLLGSITVIAAVDLLGDFLETGVYDETLGWHAAIVLVFALLGLIFALTDRFGGNH